MVVQVIHRAVKGRVRYKIKELYRSPSLQSYLEQALEKHSEIKQVTANATTGNLLLRFAPDQSQKAVTNLIEQEIKTYQDQGAPEPVGEGSEAIAPQEDQPTAEWHLMEPEEILEQFQTSEDSGLRDDLVAEYRQKYGTNSLTESKTRSDWQILAEQFDSLPVALLGVAGGVSLLTGGFADAIAIAGIVLTNSIIGYTTESQSEKIISTLQKEEKPVATVMRGGQKQQISSEEVVIGDLLLLESGQIIPADGRLLKSETLQVDESALTGESNAVTKEAKPLEGEDIPLAERSNMVYKGTFVTGGTGRAVVTATGKFSEMGQIQGMVSSAESSETPLQQQLDEVGSQLVMLCGGVCGIEFLLGLARGYGILSMLKTAISLAVASVPEGLPAIATTTLALGMRDMRKHHILIRGLKAVEALGSVQVICLDKTGTLTQNKMIVEEVHIGIGVLTRAEDQLLQEETPVTPDDSEALKKLLQISVLCSDSEINKQGDGEYDLQGSATENALVDLAIAQNLNPLQLREEYPRSDTYPRSEDRNLMTTIHETPDQKQFVATKGSPEEVLARCSQKLENGEVVPLRDDDQESLELENERMAGKALRVLGFAYKIVDHLGDNPEADLIWLGLTGMADPIRPGVTEMIKGFHKAGIKTVMITGDQSPTAYAIAKELGLSQDQNLEILDASDLAKADPEKLQALSDKVDVFARISPADKLQIVEALQASGKIVAMTGDGINDTPALKKANVGIAMGSGKAKVVREVADVIIEDDRLETLINTVSQGRTIYNNIRKSVHFLLSTNFSEIMVTTAATALGLGEPLNTMQLLWLNIVSDILPGLALAMEPPEKGILDQPPRDPEERIIKESDFERIAFESGVISLSALTAYSYGILKYGQSNQSSTLVFMSLTLGQVLHTVSCRSETHRFYNREELPANPYIQGAVVGSIALQLLPLVIPGLGKLMQLAPLDPVDWMVVASSATLPLFVNEATKGRSQLQVG
jgi:Ca2+-transporting ATPase